MTNRTIKFDLERISSGAVRVKATVDVDGSHFLLVPDGYGSHTMTEIADPNNGQLKYSLTPESGLQRLRALRNGKHFRKGDLGGLIEAAYNLDQAGDAWVARYARVTGAAYVFGDALVADQSAVSGDARIAQHAIVAGSATVTGGRVSGSAQVGGLAVVSGGHVCGDARLTGTVRMQNGTLQGSFEASRGVFGTEKSSVFAEYGRVCVNGHDGDMVPAVENESHLFAVQTLAHGPLAVYRATHVETGVVGFQVSVGCQVLDDFDELDDLVAEDATWLERAMVAGFKDMVRPLIASWGVNGFEEFLPAKDDDGDEKDDD